MPKPDKPQALKRRRSVSKAAQSPEPTALSREQIVAAALTLIDSDGLDAFSMRDVAEHLGVYHRAIYWHFPDGKNAVLAAVAAVAFQDVAASKISTDAWDAWLRDLFRRYRTALRRHPNVAPLLGARLVSNAGVDPILVEHVLRALTAAGFEGAQLIACYNAVIAAMLGYVTLELAPAPASDPAWAEAFEQKLQNLPAQEFPLLTAHRARMVNKAFVLRWQSGVVVPLTSGFDTYVEVFVSGLKELAKEAANQRKRPSTN